MRNKSFRLFLLLAAIFPFLVGFDTPDSTGTYVGLGAGKGAYHLVGCRGNFDSEFWEGQASVRHRFDTDPGGPDASDGWLIRQWDRLKPRSITPGVFADAIGEELTLVAVHRDTNGNLMMQEPVGHQFQKRGFAGGGYLTADWKWVGLTFGQVWLYRNSQLQDLNVKEWKDIFGIRLGPSDRFYASFNSYASTPTLTGGGANHIGVGGKWRSTRIWAGVGEYPERNKDSTSLLGILKVSQGLGPYTLSLTAQGNAEDIPPANLGIDKEYGVSLALEYRLPF